MITKLIQFEKEKTVSVKKFLCLPQFSFSKRQTSNNRIRYLKYFNDHLMYDGVSALSKYLHLYFFSHLSTLAINKLTIG